jgi:hypothetical protein
MKQAFRSGLEKNLSEKLDGQYKFEPYSLPYTTHRKYIPDFVHEDKKVLIECKGFFRAGDTQKYTAVRDSLDNWELVFVLSNPSKKVRKGGKITMGEWCEKNNFKHYTVDTAKEMTKYIKGKKKPCP